MTAGSSYRYPGWIIHRRLKNQFITMGEREQHNRDWGNQPGEGDNPKPLFELGQIVGTPGALQALEEDEQSPFELLLRHVTGDWNELPEEDVKENKLSVEKGYRIFSSYTLKSGEKIWLITEHDRSVTTILKPEDY
jgi:hypothetical protein